MMNTIKEELINFFSNEKVNYITGGTSEIKNDINIMFKIISNTIDEDYIIFNNAGGRHFHIWVNSNSEITEGLIDYLGNHVYMYRLNGEEVILKSLMKY